MNMFKKNGGFTLVELIVVIAILAILAGVAVPAYSGYISKANEASDYTMLDSVKTAVIFEAMDADTGHDCVITKMTVTEGSTTVTIEGTDLNTGLTSVDVKDYVSAIDFKSDNNTAEWTSATNEWKLSKVTTPTT